MKYFIFLSVILLSSCSLSRKVQTHKTEDIELKTREEVKIVDSLVISDSISTDTTKVEFNTIEVTITEFEVISDTLSNTTISLPKKITTIKKTNLKTQQGKTESSPKINATTTYTKESDKEISIALTEDKVKNSKFSNTAIVRLLYLVIAVILMSYILIKKYFPSIFVNITKSLKSIIK